MTVILYRRPFQATDNLSNINAKGWSDRPVLSNVNKLSEAEDIPASVLKMCVPELFLGLMYLFVLYNHTRQILYFRPII